MRGIPSLRSGSLKDARQMSANGPKQRRHAIVPIPKADHSAGGIGSMHEGWWDWWERISVKGRTQWKHKMVRKS